MVIERGTIMNNWISVKDKLPPSHQNVLCCGVKGGMFVGRSSGQTYDKFLGKAIFQVCDGKSRCATHWLPIPERLEKNS